MATTTPIETSKNEVFYEAVPNELIGNSAVHYVYPPSDLYNNNGDVLDSYKSIPDDSIVNVDVAFLRLKHYRDASQEQTHNDGQFANTNVAGGFFATDREDYFYVYTGEVWVTYLEATTSYLYRGT